MIRYILDKNAHIKLEKDLEKEQLPEGFVHFMNYHLYHQVPRSLLLELEQSYYARYSRMNVPKYANTNSLCVQNVAGQFDIRYEEFNSTNISKCEKVTLQNIGTVEETDMEIISLCVQQRDEAPIIIVTGDNPMRHLAKAFGLQVILYSEFVARGDDWIRNYHGNFIRSNLNNTVPPPLG